MPLTRMSVALLFALALSGCADGHLWPMPWQTRGEDSTPGPRIVYKAPPMAPAPQAFPDDAPKLDHTPAVTTPIAPPVDAAPQAKPKKCHFWQRKCLREQREQEKK